MDKITRFNYYLLVEGAGRQARTHLSEQLHHPYIFPGHDCAATRGAVMCARVLVDTPVAGPRAAYARLARGVAAAVVEGEVAGHEVLVGFAGPDGQGDQSVVRRGRDFGSLVEGWRGAAKAVVHDLSVGGGSVAPYTLVLGAGWKFRESSDCQFHLQRKRNQN